MLVLEAKVKGKTEQYSLIDEAIRTALFVRNNLPFADFLNANDIH
ncbi:MAG: hypothetical protein WCP16_02615 [Pseudanabaena sp. ELA645]|jgi:hypothetical protein